MDRLLTTAERGELAVKTPVLELRVGQLNRTVSRLTTAVMFAGLVVAGSLLYGTEPTLAKVILAISVLPLLAVMLGGRRRGPR